jgi:integrase
MLGLRREEIVGLKWDCVDFDKKSITISNSRTQAGSKIVEKSAKNDSSFRILYLPEELAGLLQKKKVEQAERKSVMKYGYQDTGFVLTWDDGRPYRPNYLSELFKKLVEKNALPKISIHGLRHSFSSIANDLGVSLYDISKALGHSSVNITE